MIVDFTTFYNQTTQKTIPSPVTALHYNTQKPYYTWFADLISFDIWSIWELICDCSCEPLSSSCLMRFMAACFNRVCRSTVVERIRRSRTFNLHIRCTRQNKIECNIKHDVMFIQLNISGSQASVVRASQVKQAMQNTWYAIETKSCGALYLYIQCRKPPLLVQNTTLYKRHIAWFHLSNRRGITLSFKIVQSFKQSLQTCLNASYDKLSRGNWHKQQHTLPSDWII